MSFLPLLRTQASVHTPPVQFRLARRAAFVPRETTPTRCAAYRWDGMLVSAQIVVNVIAVSNCRQFPQPEIRHSGARLKARNSHPYLNTRLFSPGLSHLPRTLKDNAAVNHDRGGNRLRGICIPDRLPGWRDYPDCLSGAHRHAHGSRAAAQTGGANIDAPPRPFGPRHCGPGRNVPLLPVQPTAILQPHPVRSGP